MNIRSRRNALGWGSSNKLSPKNNSVSIHLNNVGRNYSLIITPVEFEVDIIIKVHREQIEKALKARRVQILETWT